ncbi:MAG: endonuclease III [Planctomycetota bacterium]|jgi:endonuclease-3
MPTESNSDLKKRTLKVIAALKNSYPDADCSLQHADPLQLLVATILSAQCTDDRVNIVTQDLFAKYTTAADYAAAPQDTLAEEVRSTGFYRNKAKNIRAAAAMIVDHYDGKVPATMTDLLSLPGVARKTANVVLSKAFGIYEGIVVDTHVKRLSGRLGFTANTDPTKIERDLMEIAPKKQWGHFSHLLIFHGRCTARSPNCPNCPVSKLCPSAGKV